jgi:putative flippase GtrA
MARQLKQIAAYLVVGTLAAALYYLLIYVLYGLLTIHYLVSVSIAYAVAVAFHFLMNRNVTFGSRDVNPRRQGVRYVALAAFNYALNVTVVFVAVDLLALNVYVSSALGIIATMVVGFLGMKHWVFSREAYPDAEIKLRRR